MPKRLPSNDDLNKIETVQEAVCAAYKLRRFELLKRTTTGLEQEARYVGMYLVYKLTNCTAEQITKAFLYSNHRTLNIVLNELKQRVLKDEQFKRWVLEIGREVAVRYKNNYIFNK